MKPRARRRRRTRRPLDTIPAGPGPNVRGEVRHAGGSVHQVHRPRPAGEPTIFSSCSSQSSRKYGRAGVAGRSGGGSDGTETQSARAAWTAPAAAPARRRGRGTGRLRLDGRYGFGTRPDIGGSGAPRGFSPPRGASGARDPARRPCATGAGPPGNSDVSGSGTLTRTGASTRPTRPVYPDEGD